MSTHLPIIGTSAPTTAFCAARLDGPLTHLFVDGNQKITRGNGTYQDPKPNAFSLVQIADCPGSTEVCRASCYVHGLEQHAGDTHALYRHNSEAIRLILADNDAASAWATILADWIKHDAPGGFRWHVSGDVFSLAYAAWIADVCRASASVPHWIYTRSFSFLDPLVEVCTQRGGNLALNLSADAANWSEAVAASGRYNLRLCYLATGHPADDRNIDALAADEVIFPDYPLRPRQSDKPTSHPWWQELLPSRRKLVCPVDAFGKSESLRCGPCSRCLT
jgi:hypothetical protein